MPCKKGAMNFKKRHFEKKQKLAIFKSLPKPFRSMYFNETCQICLLDLSCYHHSKSTRISLNNFGNTVIQSFKSGKTGKVASFPCRERTNLWIYSWHSLPDQKRFIPIPPLNFPEMRPLGTLVNFIKRLPWKQ